MVRILSNDPEDRGSIPAQDIIETQKMLLCAFLLKTQH